MDAFFAAVEQKDFPQYRGKPVIVGGNPQSRGVVSTASYEARVFGVKSAMPSFQAYKLCPQGIFVHPRMDRYREISDQVMAILRQHTDIIQEVSVDEAYLDVTRHRLGMEDPVMVARTIKETIHAVTGLTASAGVSFNPLLAKLASDFKKPDGLTVVRPEDAVSFLAPLPVRRLPGIGPVTEKELEALGYRTCADLTGAPLAKLTARFGKWGKAMRERAAGVDESEIEAGGIPKQSSSEETFSKDVLDTGWMKKRLEAYAEEVMEGIRASGLCGRTVVLKVKYHDFNLITRSHTASHVIASAAEMHSIACGLLENKTLAGKKPIRLLGLGLSGLTEETHSSSQRQMPSDLFLDNPSN